MNHAQAEEVVHLLREILVKISAIEHRLDNSPFVGRPMPDSPSGEFPRRYTARDIRQYHSR